MLSGFGANAVLVRLMRLAVPLSIASIGFLEGLGLLIPIKVSIAWYLPYFLFIPFDFFLAQSEHYGTASQASSERIDLAKQYQISWNLGLPAVIALMLMRRNLHAEHHYYPGTHWTFASDKKSGRTFQLTDYLKSWWTNGPRMMT